ncbi:hypothetical protein MCHI_003328 [Candidatus Magnetoovum chiemensis]|nr:hypothetical protein MCHI_003328 [Candidatus Magnetoovum chiemensis]
MKLNDVKTNKEILWYLFKTYNITSVLRDYDAILRSVGNATRRRQKKPLLQARKKEGEGRFVVANGVSINILREMLADEKLKNVIIPIDIRWWEVCREGYIRGKLPDENFYYPYQCTAERFEDNLKRYALGKELKDVTEEGEMIFTGIGEGEMIPVFICAQGRFVVITSEFMETQNLSSLILESGINNEPLEDDEILIHSDIVEMKEIKLRKLVEHTD